MGRGDLTDAEWERLRSFLLVSNRRCGRWRDHRQVTDGILHRVRTGVQWRDLPERFGPWKTVYERHRLWPRLGPGRPRVKPESLAADKAYSNGPVREYLRRRGIRHALPEKADGQAARLRKGSRGGRPPGFDEERYKKRNTVERTINRLKQSRAVATRYDKRLFVYLGTATAAAIVIWLRT
ncbi:transposase [Streptomyces exfoliatus]|uniref:transposase n=1 Tax=Streptomyces exfoliatus TaxID=1905 RepID=UPI003C2DC950